MTLAFEALSMGKLFRDPQQDRALPEAKVFIVSWVDFSHKYGMGYALTDGSVGVRYNDSTSIIVSPDKSYVAHTSVPSVFLTTLQPPGLCYSEATLVRVRPQEPQRG